MEAEETIAVPLDYQTLTMGMQRVQGATGNQADPSMAIRSISSELHSSADNEMGRVNGFSLGRHVACSGELAARCLELVGHCIDNFTIATKTDPSAISTPATCNTLILLLHTRCNSQYCNGNRLRHCSYSARLG